MSNKWGQKIVGPRCVVTGCDATHEWMLSWWWKHYNKTNSYPVVFADFGMTQQARKWCRERGTLLTLSQKYKRNWFKKPRAILESPYKIVIWVDLDCEVRKDLNPLFLHADKGIGVTKDPYTPFCKKHVKMGKAVATGVVVARHGHPLIVKWANIVDAKHQSMRGDQEAFNSMLHKIKDQLSIMPPDHQWLRRDGDNKDAIIMHWTGPRGKNYIKKKLPKGARQPPRNVTSRPSKPKKIKNLIKPASVAKPKPIKKSKMSAVPVTVNRRKPLLRQKIRVIRSPR
jgi:hypothetical protein